MMLSQHSQNLSSSDTFAPTPGDLRRYLGQHIPTPFSAQEINLIFSVLDPHRRKGGVNVTQLLIMSFHFSQTSSSQPKQQNKQLLPKTRRKRTNKKISGGESQSTLNAHKKKKMVRKRLDSSSKHSSEGNSSPLTIPKIHSIFQSILKQTTLPSLLQSQPLRARSGKLKSRILKAGWYYYICGWFMRLFRIIL